MSYDMIDRFLRNNLDDDNYAEYSAALDELCTTATQQCNYCNGSGRMVRDPDIGTDHECFVCDGAGAIKTEQPAQRTWVGLTDKEIESIFNNWPTYHLDHEEFARAIEATLREKNS